MPKVGTTALVIAGVAVLAIVVVAIAGFIYLPSAQITVTPRSEPIPPISLTVKADPDATATDAQAGIVPASRVDVPVSVYPPCGDATEHYEFVVTSLSGERIVVHVVYSIEGLATCNGGLADATKDCTADRSFEFTWRHACAGQDDSSGCQ